MIEPVLDGQVQTDGDSLLRAGNTNCGGCGMSVGLNMLSHALDGRPVQLVIPACCGIVTAGSFPWSAYGAPVVAATFAAAAAVASGLTQIARLNNEPTTVICWAGDGGTYDIGMATVSAAAERNENILYICYDNEIYGNTGGQRSSSTPTGASTTTTPGGKGPAKKDILGIMAAHRIPYTASIDLSNPTDTIRKIRTAIKTEGFRFLHMLAPCPTGWKSEPAEGIELIRLAVQSGLYPVYEVFDGRRIEINTTPTFADDTLQRYFESQGRFRKGDVNLDHVRSAIDQDWEELRWRAKLGAGDGIAT